MSDAYITVNYDKYGKVVSVQGQDRIAEHRRGEKGPSKPGEYHGKCKVVKVVTKAYEILVCDEKPGSDPCCYRDPETGDEWCWC